MSWGEILASTDKRSEAGTMSINCSPALMTPPTVWTFSSWTAPEIGALIPEHPIFVLGQPSVLYTICRFANAVGWILLDIALIDCIGEHPAEQPDRPCSSTEPTFHNRFATFLLGLLDR